MLMIPKVVEHHHGDGLALELDHQAHARAI